MTECIKFCSEIFGADLLPEVDQRLNLPAKKSAEMEHFPDSPERKRRKARPLRNVMLWIGDLIQLRPGPELGVDTFAVMGVVVGVIAPADLEESRRPVAYHVDDGTGVIKVCHFVKRQVQEANSRRDLGCEGLASDPLVARAKRELEAARSAFPIGTCVEAKGPLQEYRGQVELRAFSVREAEPGDEVARMETVARLKREEVYPENLRPRRRPPATDKN